MAHYTLSPKWIIACPTALLIGCTPAMYRKQADEAAYQIIDSQQRAALGKDETFTIDSPSNTLRRRLVEAQKLAHAGPASFGVDQLEPVAHWPEDGGATGEGGDGQVDAGESLPDGPLVLTLTDALQVAARNNRDYQSQKEDVFRTALDLDLERNEFRYLFFSSPEATYTDDPGDGPDVRGVVVTGPGEVRRKLKTGALFSFRLALDLAKLLTQDRTSSMGILADATITIPLLRGAGEHIVTEPLAQAQREVVYSLFSLERFKRTLAVRVASDYLAVLQQLDQVRNAEENYRSLIKAARRAGHLADAGRLPDIQVDQARQDELRARNRWISAQQSYARRLDAFKTTLGLPADAEIELERGELDRLAEAARSATAGELATQPIAGRAETAPAEAPVELAPPTRAGGGRYELPADEAIAVALTQRLDLRTAHGRVVDAQRRVVVAADALKAGLTFVGTGRAGASRGLGSTDLPDADLRPEQGIYTAGLLLDLPLERTAERNAYRNSWIALQRAVRDIQDLEDQIKVQIRDALRTLVEARESARIQAQAVALAQSRVESTELFLRAGRAEIRDVLEAREALVEAQDALSAALVNYRVAELELQRDMGVLEINQRGLWREYEPTEDLEQ